ncbi:MAG: hypothetical protein Q8Q39_00445 [bacterium]|nr:hypothetical protein [bacterium]
MSQQTRQHTKSGGGDGNETVTITVIGFGGESHTVTVKKGESLKKILKDLNLNKKIYALTLNNQALKMEEGELVDDMTIEEDAVLTVEVEQLTGGARE